MRYLLFFCFQFSTICLNKILCFQSLVVSHRQARRKGVHFGGRPGSYPKGVIIPLKFSKVEKNHKGPPYDFAKNFSKKVSKILMVLHYDFSQKMTIISYFLPKRSKIFHFFYKNCNFLSIFSLKTSISQKIFACDVVF